MQRRVEPLELPPDRFCNLVYFWLAQNRDEDGMRELDRELSMPLPGRPAATASGVWTPEAEMEAFFVAQAATAG